MKTMKGVVTLILAIVGTGLLFSCKKDSTDLDVANKIIGNWISATKEGEPFLTNEKVVIQFTSSTKAYMSGSFSNYSEMGASWLHKAESDVVINGNNITLTNHYDLQTTAVIVLRMTDITESGFTATQDFTMKVNGAVVLSQQYDVHYDKVKADFAGNVIGTWQGRCTSGGSAYDDEQEHRWQYLNDGSYVYYVKDGDNWVPGENTVSEYFVAGNLLCTRWESGGQMNREWWEIAIDGNTMNWSGLRKNEKGETVTVTFRMNKVQ